jgi:hypothetical protein
MRLRLASKVSLRRTPTSNALRRSSAVWPLCGTICGFSGGAAEAEPEVEDGERKERADGVEKRIVRRGGAAGDEGLMDFVHNGVACSYGESGDTPGPAPALAIAADATVEQNTKNKIFGEVRAFADDVVNEIELSFCEMRVKPLYDYGENRRGVVGREGVGRESENDASPDDCRPPGANPGGDEKLVQARLQLRQVRSGAGIAPGLRVRQV